MGNGTTEINQLRKDPLTGQWVVIGKRIGKVKDYLKQFCPFCSGGNSEHEKEILCDPLFGPWQIKVVPDKYPIFTIEGLLGREAVGIYDQMNAVGAHEIVIESPNHDDRLANFSVEHLERIISVWQKRIADLKKDERFRYILIFRNEGEVVFLKHPHSQIVATSFVPRRIDEELWQMKDYFSLKERCLVCDIVKQELEGRRIVDENERFVAITPFASRFPYEIQILPKNHNYSFEKDTDQKTVKEFAQIIKITFQRLEKVLDEPAYTICLHSSPNELSAAFKEEQWKTLKQDFHWHLEIMPKTSRTSGFERAAGIYTDPTSPEEAAEILRKALD